MRLKNKSTLPDPAKARVAKCLTQRALAALVPTTQATVNACEREGVYPKHRALRAAYLAALNLSEPVTETIAVMSAPEVKARKRKADRSAEMSGRRGHGQVSCTKPTRALALRPGQVVP